MAKKRVILGQLGWAYDSEVYLPVAAGMLAAHCLASPEFNVNYEIDPWLRYERDDPKKIVDGFENPAILGLSLYVWCERISLEVARLTKERFPDCLIVFGGPSVDTHHGAEILRRYPFVDVLVHGEGEETFRELCLQHVGGYWSTRCLGISYLHPDPAVGYYRSEPRPREKNLDRFPSPFLTGLFDRILDHPVKFSAVWEPDRGCPFACTFCNWGSATASKINTFSMDRLRRELEWFADNEIDFIYGASANFGQLFDRDRELAEYMVDLKRERGYPKRFMVNTAKNATERIFTLSKLLHDSELSKGATLSMQSWDGEVLVNIKRANIRLSTYEALQEKFRGAGVPTYSELILGLPGETFETFCAGIDKNIAAGQHDGLFVYLCRVLPGTEMSEPDYREAHGIRTVLTPIQANHASRIEDDVVTEFEETIVGTKSMPIDDWLRANEVAWFVTVFHQMGQAYHLLEFLRKCHGVSVTSFARWAIANEAKFQLFSREVQRARAYYASVARGAPEVDYSGLNPEVPEIRWPVEEVSWIALGERQRDWLVEACEMVASFLGDVTSGVKVADFLAVIQAQQELARELVHWRNCSCCGGEAEFVKKHVWYGRRGGSFIRKKGKTS